MATGKSGYVDFTSTIFTVRVYWEETYDATTAKSVVSITDVQFKISDSNYALAWYPGGTCSVDGSVVCTMDYNNPATHMVSGLSSGAFVSIGTINSGKTMPWASREIDHDADGSKTVAIALNLKMYSASWQSSWGSYPSITGSESVALTTIPRASAITSASDVTLGGKCSVTWTPKSTSFRYKLMFSLGEWSYTTGAIHPNTTDTYTYTGYTIPLEVAEQITSTKTGTMQVTLYTYSDSGATIQTGDADSNFFTVTVPNNSQTQPALTMALSAVNSLVDAFDGLYIQGKSKVKAALSATGKYGATIKSYSMKVNGISYGADNEYTSGYISQYGTIKVYGYAMDSRGYTGSASMDITVLPYSNPQIMAVSGEIEVVAVRCDADGNLSDSGTYLKIKARRSYSPVESGGVQKNFCQIRYRYKLASAASWSSWATILAASDLTTDEIVTEALLGGVLSVKSTYQVQVQAVDDVGEYAETLMTVPTDIVFSHKTKNGMGLGKYCEGENLLDVGWDAHFHGDVLIGDEGLTLKEYIQAVISEGG